MVTKVTRPAVYTPKHWVGVEATLAQWLFGKGWAGLPHGN